MNTIPRKPRPASFSSNGWVGIGVDSDDEKLYFNPDGTLRCVVDTTATQTLTNKTLTSPAFTAPTFTSPVISDGINLEVVAAVAAGANQGNATALTGGICYDVTLADGTKGVVLPTAVSGTMVYVYNNSASNLKVYPNTSDDINDGTVNVHVLVAANVGARFHAVDVTTWAASYTAGGTYATLTGAETLTNKVLQDSTTTIVDDGDATKILKFQCSGITTGTTRTLTVPDASDTIVGLAATQTLTNKTLTSPVFTAPALGVATGTSLAVTGGITSSSAAAGIGYATGAGAAVTQGTNRTTAVIIAALSGAITLISAAGSATPASFTVTNSSVAIGDVVVVSQRSGTDLYEIFVTAVATGSFRITSFTTGGTTTETPVFNFAVIKAVSA